MDDISSLLFGAEPDAEAKSAALVAALRRQRGANETGRSLGNLGLLTGDKVLSRFGQAQLQNANQIEDGLAQQEGRIQQANQFRLTQALAAQRAAKGDAMQREKMAQDQSQFDKELAFRRWKANQDAAAFGRKLEASEKKGGADGGKDLPPTQLNELADYDVAARQIDELEGEFNKRNMGSMSGKAGALATKLFGYQGDAAAYLAKAEMAQQVIGKILEGGKLAEGDSKRYAKMTLAPGDSPDVVRAKTDGMKAFMADIKAGRVKVYRQGGYKVPAEAEGVPPAPPAASAGWSDADEARMAELERLARGAK